MVGSGPRSVVLLHGLYCCKEFWDGYLPLLPPDYRAVVPDLLGHGDSPEGITYSMDEHIRGIQALLDELRMERTALIGHSMGGALALAFALSAPDRVEKLVLCMTPFTERGVTFVLRWLGYPVFHTIAHSLNHLYFRQQFRSSGGIWDQLLLPSRRTITQCVHGLKAFGKGDRLRAVSELSMPIFCFHTPGDPTLGYHQVAAAKMLLPQACHLVIPGASHAWPAGGEEQFADFVNPFLLDGLTPAFPELTLTFVTPGVTPRV